MCIDKCLWDDDFLPFRGDSSLLPAGSVTFGAILAFVFRFDSLKLGSGGSEFLYLLSMV